MKQNAHNADSISLSFKCQIILFYIHVLTAKNIVKKFAELKLEFSSYSELVSCMQPICTHWNAICGKLVQFTKNF